MNNRTTAGIVNSRLRQHLQQVMSADADYDMRFSAARKAAEALCKCAIIDYYGSEKATQILEGKIDPAGRAIREPVELSLARLTELVVWHKGVPVPFLEKSERDLFRTRMDVVRTRANRSAHDAAPMPESEAKSQLSEVIKSLSSASLQVAARVVLELDPNLHKKLSGIANKTFSPVLAIEDARSGDIVRLIFPGREIIEDAKVSKWDMRIGYEYAIVNTGPGPHTAFLFLKKSASVRNSVLDFIQQCKPSFNGIYACIPKSFQPTTGSIVDKIASLQAVFDEAGSEQDAASRFQVECSYLDDFVWVNCLEPRIPLIAPDIQLIEHFVDQEIYRTDPSGEVIDQGICLDVAETIVAQAEQSTPIILISGPAGVGKTTFSKHLADRINDKYERKHALLISSTDLRSYKADSTVRSVSDLYDLHRKCLGPIEHSLHRNNLEINISCGNLVLIIDGIDEIASMLQDDFVISDFFQSAQKLNEAYSQCVIFITFRDYYRERLQNVPSAEFFELKGFDEQNWSDFLHKRLVDDDKIREASRLLNRSQKLTDNSRQTPLIVSLAAEAADRPSMSKTFDANVQEQSSFFFASTPIDQLLRTLTEREIANQSLSDYTITCNDYLTLIEEVVIGRNSSISHDELDELIAYLLPAIPIASESEKYPQFYVSPFLQRDSAAKGFRIRFAYIEYWIKARKLLLQISNGTCFETTQRLLAEVAAGEGDLITEIQEVRNTAAIRDFDTGAAKVLQELVGKISHPSVKRQERNFLRRQISGLLYIVCSSSTLQTKEAITKQLVSLWGNRDLEYFSIIGSFFPLNLRKLRFWNGYFEGYDQLSKCTFPDPAETVFNGCEFQNMPPQKGKMSKELFDTSCLLQDVLLDAISAKDDSDHEKRLAIKKDLAKVLRVGYVGGGFVWRSEDYHKKVELSVPVKLSAFLAYLVDKQVLNKTPIVGAGTGYGYTVAKPYRSAAAQLIENQLLTQLLENIVNEGMARFYK